MRSLYDKLAFKNEGETLRSHLNLSRSPEPRDPERLMYMQLNPNPDPILIVALVHGLSLGGLFSKLSYKFITPY